MNLVDKSSGLPVTAAARAELPRLKAKLAELCAAIGTVLAYG